MKEREEEESEKENEPVNNRKSKRGKRADDETAFSSIEHVLPSSNTTLTTGMLFI
jgi:hypothetical protein